MRRNTQKKFNISNKNEIPFLQHVSKYGNKQLIIIIINFEIVADVFQMEETNQQCDMDLTVKLEIFDTWSFMNSVCPVKIFHNLVTTGGE
jgi:hypothetical protein